MTVKPSNQLSSVFVSPVRIKKHQRKEIAELIKSKTGKRIPVPGHDETIEKKAIGYDPRTEKYQSQSKELRQGTKYYLLDREKKVVELTKPIYESIQVDEYKPVGEAEIFQVFYQRLENAVEHYVADLILDELRPESSQVKKRAKQLKNASLRVGKHMRDLDDRTLKAIEVNFEETRTLLDCLEKLMDACDSVMQAKISRELQARFNLCLAVINAMHDLELKFTSRRGELADSLVKFLANDVAYGYCKNHEGFEDIEKWVDNEAKPHSEDQKERLEAEHRKVDVKRALINDTNDSLCAAMVEFQSLKKTG